MPLSSTHFFNTDAEAYEIEQSLRFDGSSHLNRTPSSAGTTTTWTFSCWLKLDGTSEGCPISAVDGSGYAALFHSVGANAHFRLSRYVGSNEFAKSTTAAYRDPSAWYHLVTVFDSTNSTPADRIRYYVNGARVTDFSNDGSSITNLDPAEDETSGINSNTAQRIGSQYDGTYAFLKGYMAEVHMLDGTAVTDAEDFGEYDSNGIWRPIAVSGVTYGTNGFYLKFDETATNGIGHDHSGRGNNWTASGFTTSGPGTDVMSDTPTKNWCTLNPLSLRASYNNDCNNGNLGIETVGGDWDRGTKGTVGVSSGKWYWEYTHGTIASGYPTADIGITKYEHEIKASASGGSASADTYLIQGNNGNKYNNGSGSSYGSAFTSNDICSIALDLDNGKVWFGKNGTYFNSGSPSSGTNAAFTGLSGTFWPLFYWGISAGTSGVNQAHFNFGQREFAYPPGTSSATDYFNTVTFTAGTTTVTGVGFQPDFVWVKNRDQNYNHRLIDVVRGVKNDLYSNAATAEQTNQSDSLLTFTSDGFTHGKFGSADTEDMVAWCWKAGGTASSNTDGDITSSVSANQDAGFSVVTYQGNGVGGQTVGHGLGQTLDMCIVKSRGSNSWFIRHESMNNDRNFNFNTSGEITAGGSGIIADLSSGGTGSQQYFTLQQGSNNVNNVNEDQVNYVAYCWTEKEGVSKFGSYDGNGSTDGPYIELGFSPAMIIVKRKTGGTGGWIMLDKKRDPTNPNDTRLEAQSSYQDYTIGGIDFESNGFKLRTDNGEWNASGSEYVFAAFAENFSADEDFKSLNTANLPAPDIEDGSKNFDTEIWDGTNNSNARTLEFEPSFLWVKARGTNANSNYLYDQIRGNTKYLNSDASGDEGTESGGQLTSFDSSGFTVATSDSHINKSGNTYAAWAWKGNGSSTTTPSGGSRASTVIANPSAGFSIVSYIGTGNAETIAHGLGAKPALIITKNRDRDQNWAVYHSALGAEKALILDDNYSQQDATYYWNDTEPTATVYSIGTWNGVSSNTENHIAYCFAEVEGYSKFGLIKGNYIDDGPFVYLGFTPAFLMLKNAERGSTDWVIIDVARDTYNYAGKTLRANTSAVEDTRDEQLDILSNGFKLRTRDLSYNGPDDSPGIVYAAFASNPFGGDGVSPTTAR